MTFPKKFSDRMHGQLGNDYADFENAHRQRSPISIRINPTKKTQQPLERIAWTEFGYYLSERPSFTLDPLFHAGTYYVQEASSMFVEQAVKQTVDLEKRICVLDLCGAPGGKSTHLLSLISKNSLLVSNETIRSRATILAENICKWGNLNVVITNNDPNDFKDLNGFFDVVLVDAPCSGEGLFRKDPDAINEWSEENSELCSLRQQRILNAIWPALKKDGLLIYSTCTYNKKENEENIKPWVQSGKAESIKLKLDNGWAIHENITDGVVGYHFFPHCVKGEGFFISVLRKTENEETKNIRPKKWFKNPSKEMTALLLRWLKNPDEVNFILHDDLAIGLHKDLTDEIEFLSKHLKVIQKGTAICTIKHNKFIPEHTLAMSNEINQKYFPCHNLNFDQAISYIRKDVLSFPSETKGHALVAYQNTPLGWINHLGNRINNLYPSEWRIRNVR